MLLNYQAGRAETLLYIAAEEKCTSYLSLDTVSSIILVIIVIFWYSLADVDLTQKQFNFGEFIVQRQWIRYKLAPTYVGIRKYVCYDQILETEPQ